MENKKLFDKFWPADIHILGKDNLRWHALLWPAILKSTRIELPKTILVNGFLNLNGQKISKSLGNVIHPSEWVKKYGADAVRYYLLRYTVITDDSDISEQKLKQAYNSNLTKRLGNLVSRVAKLCEKNNIKPSDNSPTFNLRVEVQYRLQDYRFDEALSFIWSLINESDKKINQTKPWALSKNDAKPILEELAESIQEIAYNLKPFLPETAQKIEKQFKGPKITSQKPLFPRIS